jgi:hypothetical protein
MWPFSRRRKDDEAFRLLAAEHEMVQDDKGQVLERCANDVERRSLCLQWASEARLAWYEGRRAHIAKVVASNNERYKQYPVSVRRKIGDQQWGASVQQKELAGLEQMYSRWAQSYAGTAEEGNYGIQGSVRWR